MKHLDRLVAWIAEREAIRLRRAAGESPPWSGDEIFQSWSFTNVRREDDRVTKWIWETWREPHADDPDLWFAMVVARFVNEPATLAEIGYPVPWDPQHFLAVMKERKARGEKLYRDDAYMIRADNRPGRPKPLDQVEDVFEPLWRDRKELRPRKGETLASYHRALGEYHGMGTGFMPAQIVADLKYVEPLWSATDWFTFAVSGPGSKRGLNRIIGRDKDAPWTEAGWRKEFGHLCDKIIPDLKRLGLDDLSAQDLQSCLCELDKNERVRLGEGTPKRRFRKGADKFGSLFQ